MVLGFTFALMACLIWGLIYIMPGFVTDYSMVEVALGRYFTYGILSSILLFRKGFEFFRNYSSSTWRKALFFGLVCNILYYLGILVGLRGAGGPITILITGMAPIVIALYGNWLEKEVNYKSLIFPSMCMATGMILVNVDQVDWSFSQNSFSHYFMGMMGILTALACWSWYAVQNAQFLKRNPQIPSNEWSTIIGFSTFIWTLIIGAILALFAKEHVDIAKFMHWNSNTARFFAATGTLGCVCSWLGCFLWNRASFYLPFSLMGPFLIFETVFSLIFIYVFELRFPSLMEIIGICSMLTGILMSILAFRKQQVSEQPD